MIIYANLLPALQNEAVTAAVYVLNLTPSNALRGDFLRHTIDLALSRTINANKLLLNTLRAYRATTIVYDESVLRGSKIEPRGERRQLVGYKDSMYRVWIPLKHKVKRTLYCQFIESGKLTELLQTEPDIQEEFVQQFEQNDVEPRGELLEIPDSFTLETVNLETLIKEDKTIMPTEHTDNIAQEEALKAVETTTENARLPELGRELVDTELLAGFEYNKPRLLEILVDETLERGSRSRRQTTKA